jgi:predicted TIM-barrel enzyme
MNLLKLAFPDRRHVILPVIHAETSAQSLQNAETAYANGSDGVFLINHSISTPELLRIAAEVRAKFSKWWIGLNCLARGPEEVFHLVDCGINGIWTDNALIDEQRDTQEAAERVLTARAKSKWEGLYFGGVAFKYQRQVEDLQRAARVAGNYMDVVTTSGPGTGQPALRQKISLMKSGLADKPLAIASGITPENVSEYLDVADCFLVATGISRTFTEFEPRRVRELVQVVRRAAPPGQ